MMTDNDNLKHKVFVFGTLKEGFPNFESNKGVRFRAEFRTTLSYPLFLVGERYSPWLILDSGNGYPITGQVFEVSNSALAAMDILERIKEPDGYQRVPIEVSCLATGEIILVWAYGKPKKRLRPEEIKRSLTSEYTLEHAALYRSRHGLS